METKFYILLNKLDAATLEQVELNLSAQKAVFVEDVASQWQPLYLALEYVALPESIEKPQADTLMLGWDVDFDPGELNEVVEPFKAAKLNVPVMLLVLEDGSAIRVHSLDPEEWYEERALSPVGVELVSTGSITNWMLEMAMESPTND
ncbi:hypothetical protein [Ectopseudomonas oleovorans]|uniref:hypothetical protein n=1 Tax=Ectopseudomonas oleovorans TaxID=301 RepID=UPI00244B135A|nr:hypothetical protein [Pseudomonas oleovorans]MDH2200907.1 hypothetical protein [Pseudomonas oleovorans]